mgnify:CR=1 FL=1
MLEPVDLSSKFGLFTDTWHPKIVGEVNDSYVKLVKLIGEFVWHAQSIRMRGSVAKVHVTTDGRHGLPEGTVVIAPTRCPAAARIAAHNVHVVVLPSVPVTPKLPDTLKNLPGR